MLMIFTLLSTLTGRSDCTVNTTINAVTPGAFVAGKSAVVQAFRVRLNDAGVNGTRGDGDDSLFEQQGFLAP